MTLCAIAPVVAAGKGFASTLHSQAMHAWLIVIPLGSPYFPWEDSDTKRAFK